ncbi:MAG: AmmeMemoRadiSam system protein A [bacterium]
MKKQITPETRKKLLSLARESIMEKFTGIAPPSYENLKKNPSVQSKNGVFVTLKKNKDLRGCIGTVVNTIPLFDSVRYMAKESAFRDPRFPPVSREEVDDIVIELSLLSIPEKTDGPENIKLGEHGIILKKNERQSLFLPQVATEQCWDLETTLTHLSLKAGLSGDAWKSSDCTFKVFRAFYFNEKDLKDE